MTLRIVALRLAVALAHPGRRGASCAGRPAAPRDPGTAGRRGRGLGVVPVVLLAALIALAAGRVTTGALAPRAASPPARSRSRPTTSG